MHYREPEWSSDVAQAGWIRPRLTPWGRDVLSVTSVIPADFERYARVLHPVEEPEDGEQPVRWADMAVWSGMPEQLELAAAQRAG